MRLSQGTCFHCGRQLSEVGDNPDECGCNYCSILSNILKETPVETKTSKMDASVLLLFVFIVACIAMAIFVYNWRDEAFYALGAVKERIQSNIYSCLCDHSTAIRLLMSGYSVLLTSIRHV